MNPKELNEMRLKQTGVTNGLMLIAMVAFFTIINILTITFAHFFFFLGVLLFIQAVIGLIKGDSTKSIFPIYEKVAIYEKQKVGSEWYKHRKTGCVWNLILSALMFLQSYWNRGLADNVFHLDLLFTSVMTFILLIMINIGLIFHFRKVDRSTSELDMKGYTWKSNVIAIAIGIVFAFLMIVITLSYIISHI
ncbi:hypothetical protein [Sediminibacillus massiliensis]|uniref:hypothetical protein n=1 Tax=Sediminibacillus massiliensis TaxID=1926277 RepID=UPI000988394C|nr:hypothetical protein [Sediminibacillus massiliensis]